MKRSLFLLLIIVALLTPAQAAFAQTDPPGSAMPIECQPDVAWNTINMRLQTLQTLDDVTMLLNFVLSTAQQCASAWITALTEFIMTLSGSVSMPPIGMPIEGGAMPDSTAFDPDDGVMTAEEAEFVITTAFAGDLETANRYICDTEQLTSTEIAPGMTLSSASCSLVGGNMRCSLDLGITSTVVVFQVEDGKLCASTTP